MCAFQACVLPRKLWEAPALLVMMLMLFPGRRLGKSSPNFRRTLYALTPPAQLPAPSALPPSLCHACSRALCALQQPPNV